MKNATITSIMTATMLLVGCNKKSPGSSVAPQPPREEAAASSAVAQLPERAIVTKAKRIVVPEFNLDGVAFTNAIRQLYIVARQNDPESKGVVFSARESAMAVANPKITLALTNMTLAEVTERVAIAAGVVVSAEDYGFVFTSKADKP